MGLFTLRRDAKPCLLERLWYKGLGVSGALSAGWDIFLLGRIAFRLELCVLVHTFVT
jgi:hypothetical protein